MEDLRIYDFISDGILNIHIVFISDGILNI